MVNIVHGAAAGSKGFLSYLKIFSFMLLFAIITITAVLHAIEEKSWTPILEEIGGNIVLTTTRLADISKDIINSGGVISEHTGIKKVWDLVFTYSSFLILFWMTIVWIKLFARAYEISPFSYEGNIFPNFLAGFLLFILFQILFGFFYGAMLNTLNDQEAAIKVITTPFVSFYYFAIAAYYVITPILDGSKNVLEKVPL